MLEIDVIGAAFQVTERGTLAIAPQPDRFDWKSLLCFRSHYWLVVAVGFNAHTRATVPPAAGFWTLS